MPQCGGFLAGWLGARCLTFLSLDFLVLRIIVAIFSHLPGAAVSALHI